MSDSLCPPWTRAHQDPPSMGFSRQEYWSGLPFPYPGDLLDPAQSPALHADSLWSEPPGSIMTNNVKASFPVLYLSPYFFFSHVFVQLLCLFYIWCFFFVLLPGYLNHQGGLMWLWTTMNFFYLFLSTLPTYAGWRCFEVNGQPTSEVISRVQSKQK